MLSAMLSVMVMITVSALVVVVVFRRTILFSTLPANLVVLLWPVCASHTREMKCQGLNRVRQLAYHHPKVFGVQLHSVTLAVTTEAR